MTTSGTTTFNLDLTELVEEAFERCGGELRTGYDLKTARRSLNLLFADWANRGVNMWTFEQGSIVLVPGQATYNLPASTVDLLEHVIRTGAGSASTQADLTITRISVSTYATIPNKLQQARPIQVWIERKTSIPTITVWPVPDDTQTYTFVYWRLKRIDDAGNGGVENCVEKRLPGHAIGDQVAEVFQSDPFAGPADLGIGEAQPGAEPERIGQEKQQQQGRRQHEGPAQCIAIVLEFFKQFHCSP